MSDPKSFIRRWSRRKRAATQFAQPTQPSAVPDAAAEVPAEAPPARAPGETSAIAGGVISKPAFDTVKLPAIESITAETDIRAFLAPGVPPELARAALRRAWAGDPKIREFIGLSENSWDFNAAGAIPGFGPLEMTDELRRQIARMVGRSLADEAPNRDSHAKPETADQPVAVIPAMPTAQAQSIPGTAQKPIKSDIPNNADPIPQRNIDHPAEPYDAAKPDHAEPIVKRLHGRALPE
jgi:hypothetical protein